MHYAFTGELWESIEDHVFWIAACLLFIALI